MQQPFELSASSGSAFTGSKAKQNAASSRKRQAQIERTGPPELAGCEPQIQHRQECSAPGSLSPEMEPSVVSLQAHLTRHR